MKEYYLGIDIGTYESRGMLIDENMIPVADCSVTHGMDHPQEGWFEHDADKVWWGDFCKLCRLLLEKSNIRSDEIRCVGTSALGTDCLPVDKDCNPLRPAILYGIDSRAEEEIKWLTQYYGDDVKKMFGHPICTGDTATKILWLKNHEPEVYEKTYKFLTGSSYLTAKLTGKYVIDQFLANGNGSLKGGKEFTIPGTFCIGDGTNAAGTLTRWVRDTFYEEELKKERAGGENAYAVMAREAAEVEAGSEGLIILPYIYGERSPIQDAKASGMLFGLKGTHTRKQINRAALEAVGYSTLQHMILFDEMNLPPKSVITAGGGTKNAAWMQIICDMIGRQICIPKRYQCSAYGDAAMAALGDRRFRDFTELRDSLPKGKILVPNEKNHIYYKEHYKMFRDLYLNNKDMMHRI
ncbi:FGGY family carbohydrate kinase [[Ruminococcus] torques]|uniref:FGGY family carbohydrate kinase n=1 Tax=[Ruminococcus] torques TaxID=33039 RepID=UPI0032C1399D